MAENTVSAGAFAQTGPVDRSPSGLNYQKYQMDTTARGVNGVSRRVAIEPSSLFSSPPAISGGQFGSGHAKSTVTFGGDGEPGA